MKEIPLTQGQVALVDDEDFERVNKYKWFASWDTGRRTYTARRTKWVRERENGKRGHISLHRFVMDVPKGKDIDHRDFNPLNNQKSNLRICTRAQNCMNKLKWKGCSSRFKGVSWSKEVLKWRAGINKDGKQHYLGYFNSEEEAALAYNTAALEMFGEFSLLNVISIT